MRAFMVLAALVLLSGCSTIIEGTTQELVINTAPEGANCAIEREGQVVGRVNPTPGGLTVNGTFISSSDRA